MKRKFFALLLPVALALLPSFALANYSYVPLEQIPGFGNPSDFPGYLSALYKFGLWAIGLAALLMLTIGGFIYITSAGNNSQVSTAKKIIGDSIIGIILALVAYLLLYTINPDLVKFTPLTALPMPTMNTMSTGQTIQSQLQQCSQWCNNAGSDSSSAGQAWLNNCLANCQKNAQAAANNTTSLASCGNINPELNTELEQASAQSGVPTSVLASFMQRECTPAMSNPNACSSNNSYGAGGPMQFTDQTWRAYGCTGSKFNRQDALDCAAKKIAHDSGGDYSNAGLTQAAKRYCGSCTNKNACGGNYCDGIINNNNTFKNCSSPSNNAG